MFEQVLQFAPKTSILVLQSEHFPNLSTKLSLLVQVMQAFEVQVKQFKPKIEFVSQG
jgi:hypothetical protein